MGLFGNQFANVIEWTEYRDDADSSGNGQTEKSRKTAVLLSIRDKMLSSYIMAGWKESSRMREVMRLSPRSSLSCLL